MRRSLIRFCLGLAAVLVLWQDPDAVNGDIIQQYDATQVTNSSTTPQTYGIATLNNAAVNSTGSYSSTYVSNGAGNAQGQSVVLQGSALYTNIAFSFYTGGSTTNSGVTSAGGPPIGYAAAGTTLYVFENDTSEPTSGAYTGTPMNLSPSSLGVNGAKPVGYSTTIGSSDASAYTGFTTDGSTPLILDSGHTYYFYVGYTNSSVASNFAFDVAPSFGSPSFTPYSNGISNTGDQRYRSPTNVPPITDYGGPSNSMTLFTLSGTVVPEPSRAAGLLGLGFMGLVSLFFARRPKRLNARR